MSAEWGDKLLPPDSASVKWVKSLDLENLVSMENSILIPAQARLDYRKQSQPKPVPGR